MKLLLSVSGCVLVFIALALQVPSLNQVQLSDVARFAGNATPSPFQEPPIDVAQFVNLNRIVHEPVLCIAVNPDETILAAATFSGLKFFALPSFEYLGYFFERPLTKEYCPSWSPDGRLLAISGSAIQGIELWDVSSHQFLRSVENPRGYTFINLSWSPDSHWLTADDGFIWDVNTGKLSHVLDDSAYLSSVLWSPDGLHLLSVTNDEIEIWDSQTFEKADQTMTLDETIFSADWSPDNVNIAISGIDGIYIWNILTGEVAVIAKGERMGTTVVAWSSNGTQLASVEGQNIIIWDVGTKQRIQVLEGHMSHPRQLFWLSDGITLISSSVFDTVWLWDIALGEKRHLERFDGFLTCIAISPEGKYVASGTSSGRILIWDTVSGQLRFQLDANGDQVGSLAWSPDGHYLASIEMDNNGIALVWDIATSDLFLSLERHDDNVADMAWSPDSLHLVTVAGFTGYVWDTRSGGEHYRFETENPGLPQYEFDRVAWSPDGKYLATSTSNSAITIWDAANGQKQLVLAEAQADACCSQGIAWSPDSDRLAGTVLDYETVTYNFFIWNTSTGETIMQIPDRSFSTIVWSPDGRYLLSPGRHFQIWDAWTGQIVSEISTEVGILPSADLAWSQDRTRLATMSASEIIIWGMPQ